MRCSHQISAYEQACQVLLAFSSASQGSFWGAKTFLSLCWSRRRHQHRRQQRDRCRWRRLWTDFGELCFRPRTQRWPCARSVNKVRYECLTDLYNDGTSKCIEAEKSIDGSVWVPELPDLDSDQSHDHVHHGRVELEAQVRGTHMEHTAQKTLIQ